MDASDMDRLRAALLDAAAIGDPLPRGLEAAAVVSEAVADLGVRLTVYGGLAVSLYTAGAYVSGDVDAALAIHSPGVSERLRDLGLEKVHRHWTLSGSDRLVIEFPSDTLDPGWETNVIELDSGRTVEVVTLEDIILDRIEGALSAGGTFDLYRQALLLCASPAFSESELRARAEARRIEPEYETWRQVTADGTYADSGAFYDAIRAAGTMGSALMVIRFRDIMEQAPQMRAAQAALEAESGPYQRLRPRDPSKARALRKMGTADNLVGTDARSEAELLVARVRRSS